MLSVQGILQIMRYYIVMVPNAAGKRYSIPCEDEGACKIYEYATAEPLLKIWIRKQT